ncbi:DEAD-box ATP-dependent RNA helicase 41-like isoform X2 [Papaver somniferum]|uniref:DEAD-box ATP-dependent RNA helicase 41-like isoform X2 n=1 Tax=Papaver somniferum TaxID=3469 RepID=UPI000E6F95A9|nr:DEAD-box ATP-dependent RNA helicase 41-like isoform X2 [Papaver somniferum]
MEDKHEVNDHKTLSPVTHSGEATVSVVKEKCWDQREALPGEPCCVICGRYGEYICDETDDDICSIECKSTLLGRLSNAQKREKLPHQVRIPVVDECVYVRDNDDDILKAPSLSDNEVEVLRNKLEIQVKGASVPPPILSFSSCNLPQKVQKNLEAAGYEVPTPIQMQAIPIALTGRNLLVSAATGSGKTASFLVPIVSRCSKFRLANPTSQRKPLAMVLAPTRELCVQVEEQAKVLGNGLPFKTALVVGGEPMAGQIYRIHHGVELIVGTPGRLIDLLTKHNVELDEVSILALDEVDCMLERGFRDQVMQVFLALSQPQILMYSATVPREVENIGSLLAKDLVFVTAGKDNGTNKSVKQIAIWVESKHKKRKLFEILMSQQHFKPPVVVFVGSRLGADLLSEAITVTTGIKALPFHGEKPMKERRNTLRLFLTGEVSIIVATGVLGRGVDLLKVRQVIVFDMPNSIKEYIHQIGRASRLGEEGTAFLFLNEEDKNLFQDLVGMLKSSGAVIPWELANSRYKNISYTTRGEQNKRKCGS